MYKKYFFIALFILLCFSATAQSKELALFNQKRLEINKIGMLTLGGWALSNIGTAAFSLKQASGSNKYFHQMNLYWNVVNLAIAGFGYYDASTSDPLSYGLFPSIKQYYTMEKILLLNAGLDIAYIAGGLYLIEKAKNSQKRHDLLKGYGQSIILQGGFLFLFDCIMYFIHESNEGNLRNIIDHFSFNGHTMNFLLRF